MLDFSNTQDWNFAVEERPVIVEGIGPIEGQKALVRTDTNQFLGQHSENYKVVTHDTIVNAQYDAIKEANISSDFDFNVRCLDGGKKLKIDVIFPDLTIEPEVGDLIQFRTSTFNSYDASWAYQNQADGYRLACKNGMVTSSLIAKIWAKHTSKLNIEAAANTLGKSVEIFNKQKDVWQGYMKAKVERNDVEEFFKQRVVAISQKSSEELFNKRQLNNLLGHFDDYARNLGSNKWSLYNALTHWSTHTGESSQPEVTTRYREKKVADAMASRHFLELAA